MNKITTIIIFLIIVVAVLALIYLINWYASNSYSTTNQQPEAQVPTSSNSIAISNFTFNPGVATVSAGTTVVWTNQDSVAHQIKSDLFNSAVLNKGDTFQYKFDAPGTYNYTCAIHPSMKGQIVVQ